LHRLRKNRRGQGSRRLVIPSDWKNVASMSDSAMALLLESPGPSLVDWQAYEFNRIELDTFDMSADRDTGIVESDTSVLMTPGTQPNDQTDGRRKRYRRPVTTSRESELVSADDTSSDECESPRAKRSTGQMQTLYPLGSQCQCRGVDGALTDRMGRLTAGEANMRTEEQCFRVIRTLLESSSTGSHGHVCFSHLRNVAGFIGLVNSGA